MHPSDRVILDFLIKKRIDLFERRELNPVFHLTNLFARREAKTRIRQREQVGIVPTFFSVRANKFAKWKTGFNNDTRTIVVTINMHSIYLRAGMPR